MYLLDFVSSILVSIYYVLFYSALLLPLILIVWVIIKQRFSKNHKIIVGDARSLNTRDLVGVGLMFLCVFVLAVLVEAVLWIWLTESDPQSEFEKVKILNRSDNLSSYSATYNYQLIEYIWYQLSMLATTFIFAWWWLRLKRANVNGAFVLAAGGWAMASAVLGVYRSLDETGLDVASIADNYEYALMLAIALGVLVVLAVELKRGMRYANLVVFLLALSIAMIQVLQNNLFLQMLYLMVVPSFAISNWVLISRPAMIVGSGRDRVLAGLVLAGSVVLAVLFFVVVPLMIVAPEWATGAAEWGSGVGINEIVILDLVAWTAPFIGSAVVYIVVKRISIDRIGIEWASLSWLILSFIATFWGLIIEDGLNVVRFYGLVNFPIGVPILSTVILIFLFLLGRGAAIRPLLPASIWMMAVLFSQPILLWPLGVPQITQVLYLFELALTFAMVFVISCLVFGMSSWKEVFAYNSRVAKIDSSVLASHKVVVN